MPTVLFQKASLKILFFFLLLAAFSAEAETEKDTSRDLYRDLSAPQNELAHQALNQAYSADPDEAHATLETMRKLEAAQNLPPLSFLLSMAIDVMRFQNGDFENAEAEKILRLSIEKAAADGSVLCQQGLKKEKEHPTYLFIQGGLRGFLATLKIHSNPSKAMNEGYQALKLLERSLAKDDRIKDGNMGTGIFYCTVAKSPFFIRATLKILGRSASMNQGLQSLRISAYQGQYTCVASQLFLIQFLSPYEDDVRREKRIIFKTLQETYPKNPYFTFLKTDEALCFYPDSFYRTGMRKELLRRIVAFDTTDFYGRYYANLVRYQLTLLSSKATRRVMPDTSIPLRDYRYYPVFMEALRRRHILQDSAKSDKIRSEALTTMKTMRDSCFKLIKSSPMNPTRKRYYRWHVSDALRWRGKHNENTVEEEQRDTSFLDLPKDE